MRDGRSLGYAAVCGVVSLAALAGGAELPGPVKQAASEWVRLDQAIETERARVVLESLGGMQASELDGSQRAVAARVEMVASLGVGDAARAGRALAAWREAAPADGDLHEAAWLCCAAAGDAAGAIAALKELGKSADADVKRTASVRRRGAQRAGVPAPDVALETDRGSVSCRRRGSNVLLIDFWSMLPPPDEAHRAALSRLAGEAGSDRGGLELVGVNADGSARRDEAASWAGEHGYAWPQVFEEAGPAAAISRGAFDAGRPPWVVLIDTYGFVRYVGAADDAALTYATRAALAEARGEFEPIRPRDKDGNEPPAAVSVAEAAAAPKPKAQSDTGPLPSNPEAASKLRQARAFLKTGKRTDAMRMFREIVRDYPGTQEAKEAQEYLGEP